MRPEVGFDGGSGGDGDDDNNHCKLKFVSTMLITARGKETKRERKVKAMKVVAVTPSTNA